MGKYLGYALDGLVLNNPVITGGTISDTTVEADEIKFDGLSAIFAGFVKHEVSVTVASGQTVGDSAAITMPAFFTPLWMAYEVTTAATNASVLVDIGTAGDPDGFCDGITAGVSLATTGFKGLVACNGTLGGGDITGGVTSNTTPDETRVTVNTDPGVTGVVVRLTFFGLQASATDF